MKSNEEILKVMQEILTSKLEMKLESDLTIETSLLEDGIDLDSVMLLEFIIEIEIAFDIELDEDEMREEHFKGIGQLVDLVQSKMV